MYDRLAYTRQSGGLPVGGELHGGLWVLLVSAATLRNGGLPKVMNWPGAAIGSASLLSVVPVLDSLAHGFGWLQIGWFARPGVVMLHTTSPASDPARRIGSHEPALTPRSFGSAQAESQDEPRPVNRNGPLVRAGTCYLLLPILNILVPHSGQMPWVAGLPFFIVTAFSSFIVRLVRHLTQ